MLTGVLNDATNVGNSSDNGSKKKKESKSDQIEHLDGERKKIKRTKIEKASTILEVSIVLSVLFHHVSKCLKKILNFFF